MMPVCIRGLAVVGWEICFTCSKINGEEACTIYVAADETIASLHEKLSLDQRRSWITAIVVAPDGQLLTNVAKLTG